MADGHARRVVATHPAADLRTSDCLSSPRSGRTRPGMRAGGKNLVLTAMVFAVAMMFIDQTIVVLAIPSLQHEIKLSPTGAQWIVNGYLLSLSALFAFGGRIADLWGHRRTVIVGDRGVRAVLGAVRRHSRRAGSAPPGSSSSGCCRGRAPRSCSRPRWRSSSPPTTSPSAASTWRSSSPSPERSPRSGRSPVATSPSGPGVRSSGSTCRSPRSRSCSRSSPARSQPRRREKLDLRGAALVCAGMGIAVLGLQEASAWGWSSPATWACLVARRRPAGRVRRAGSSGSTSRWCRSGCSPTARSRSTTRSCS